MIRARLSSTVCALCGFEVKDVAPSTALRKWSGHDPAKWAEFRERYFRELDDNPQAVEQLREQVRHGMTTFVFAARDSERNNAVALKEYLESDRVRP